MRQKDYQRHPLASRWEVEGVEGRVYPARRRKGLPTDRCLPVLVLTMLVLTVHAIEIKVVQSALPHPWRWWTKV